MKLGSEVAAIAALSALLASCGGEERFAPTPDASARLGPAWNPGDGTTTFRVWAPRARSAAVLFFASWDAPQPTASHPMAKDLASGGDVDGDGWNGVWQVTVPGVPHGQIYQYDVGGRRALDPYAPSMTRFDSSTQSAGRGAVVDLDSILPDDVADDTETAMIPFAAPPGYEKREDAVIYEVHVRDFTIFAQGLRNPPGTYKAFAERLDHVRDLGATHVQLLPVLAYLYGDEGERGTVEAGRFTGNANYNWGYDPQSWFAPEGMYSAQPEDPALRVKELKTLVNEAHRRGLGVVLDVVYNHTATTGVLDALVPGYFYRGTNASGVGNDTASERKMMRKLVVDSVRHWVEHYGVDGFRFDLMGLIDSRTMLDARAAAAALKPAVLFIGEGWRLGSLPGKDDQGYPIVQANQDWMTATDDVAVFSDSYRDVLKGGGFGEGDDADSGFLTLSNPDKVMLLRDIRGDATNFAADDPGDAVQYLTAHDGLTLHDKIGKILHLDPTSPSQEATIMRVARLGLAVLATSQGIAFVHGGCEMGRSKWVTTGGPDRTPANAGDRYYVYNSYDSSDGVNGFDWAALTAPGSPYEATFLYAKGLLALRASTDAFRLGTKALASANVTLLDGSVRDAIAYEVRDPAGAEAFSIFVNAGTSAAAMASGADLTAATVLVDDDEAGASAVATPSGFTRSPTQVTVQPRTAVILRRQI
jgi:secreted pullulanase